MAGRKKKTWILPADFLGQCRSDENRGKKHQHQIINTSKHQLKRWFTGQNIQMLYSATFHNNATNKKILTDKTTVRSWQGGEEIQDNSGHLSRIQRKNANKYFLSCFMSVNVLTLRKCLTHIFILNGFKAALQPGRMKEINTRVQRIYRPMSPVKIRACPKSTAHS